MASNIRRGLRLPTGESAIWLLNAFVAALAVALYLGPVDHLPAVGHDHLPWWALAPVFFVAERCVVHLQFRRSAHSFSLGDLPFVFGLLYASAFDLILGTLLGTIGVLMTERRQPPIKLVFNLAQLTLGTCLALLVLHGLLSGTGHGPGPQVWLAVFVATLVSAVIAVVLIGAAISFTEGLVKPRTIAQMLFLDAVITLTNTSVALLAALVISADARGTPLLILPLAALFFAYRAYMQERQKHETLEFLHETTQTLSRSPEVLGAIEGLLERSLAAFRAEVAEIVIFGPDGGPPLRTTLATDGRREVMQPADPAFADDLLALVGDGASAVKVEEPFSAESLRLSLHERGVTNAMVALLPGEERVIGTIMLANRTGVVSSFSAEDMKLLQTLANNASVALQYDRLEQAVAQLRTARDELEHQAFHDTLTGLANRLRFLNEVQVEVESGSTELAVLFVDVDDFKSVNDTLGHAAGDEVLLAVAHLLRQSIRPGDVVARLGGDEFAVLVRDAEDVHEAALAVATRLMKALERPLTVRSETVSVNASVGITSTRRSSRLAEALIHDADVAMYQAKAAGKHRFKVFDGETERSAA